MNTLKSKFQQLAFLIMAVNTALVSICFAAESKLVITDTEIVPVPKARRPFIQAYKDSAHLYFGQDSFTPAGKQWSDIGAVNKYATVVQDRQPRFRHMAYLLDTDLSDGTVANRLRIDVNADGIFNDNADIEISSTSRGQSRKFSADSLAVNINGKQAKIAVDGQYDDHRHVGSDYRSLHVYIGSCLQGIIQLDGKKYLIQIVDCSGRMGYGISRRNTHDTKNSASNVNDAVRIYEITADGKVSDNAIWENYYGIAAKIEDKFYTISRKPESYDIHIEKSKNKLYPVTFDMSGAYICANYSDIGTYRRVYCQGGKTNHLPAGIYKIERLGIKRGDWEMSKDYSNQLELPVYPGKDNTVKLPLPLKITANVKKNGINNYVITSALTDQNGGKFSLRQGRSNAPLKLKITDEDGQIIKKANFSYQ